MAYERVEQTTCNMSPEDIAERDRPKSRQERRAAARRARKMPIREE